MSKSWVNPGNSAQKAASSHHDQGKFREKYPRGCTTLCSSLPLVMQWVLCMQIHKG